MNLMNILFNYHFRIPYLIQSKKFERWGLTLLVNDPQEPKTLSVMVKLLPASIQRFHVIPYSNIQCTVVELFRQGVIKLFQQIQMIGIFLYILNDNTLHGICVLFNFSSKALFVPKSTK